MKIFTKIMLLLILCLTLKDNSINKINKEFSLDDNTNQVDEGRLNYLDPNLITSNLYNDGYFYDGCINLNPLLTYSLISPTKAKIFEDIEILDLMSGQDLYTNLLYDDSLNLSYIEFFNLNSITFTYLPPELNLSQLSLIEGEISNYRNYEHYDYEYEKPNNNITLECGSVQSIEELVDAINFVNLDSTNLTEYILIDSEFLEHSREEGTYSLKVKLFSNTSSYLGIFDIYNKDTEPPIIKCEDQMFFSGNNFITNEFILSQIEIKDNSLYDIKKEVINNDYDGIKDRLEITVIATDRQGNKSERDIVIHILNPQGKLYSYSPIVYSTNNLEPLNPAFFYNRLKLNSVYPAQITSKNITFDSYNQTNTPGSYQLHVEYELKIDLINEDLYSNLSSYYKRLTLEYTVIISNKNDDIKVVPKLEITTLKKLSTQDIKYYARNQIESLLNIELENVTISYNEYLGNELKEGTYLIYFHYKIDNLENYSTINVVVPSNLKDYSILIIIGVLLSIITILSIFIIKYFKKIKSFFHI